MDPYNEVESEVNVRLIKMHIGLHEPEFLERLEEAKLKTTDWADRLRLDDALTNKLRELRKKGLVPTNEELEGDVRKIAQLNPEQKEGALREYESEIRSYEGELSGFNK